MNHQSTSLVGLLAVCVALSSELVAGCSGRPPGGTGGTGGAGGSGGTGTTCLRGSGDYTTAGPYTVATTTVDLASSPELAGASSPTTYTIFYPTAMDDGCHPIIAWGNGTGVNGAPVYAFYQNNAASWGMVVIASDN